MKGRTQARPAGSTAARTPGGGDPVRKENKERARLAREAARRRVRRRESFRRALIGGTVGVVVVGVFYYLQRAAAPTPLSAAAVAAARTAGCDTDWVTPVGDPVRDHLTAGASFDYNQDPPTSGPHDSALPDTPHVYGVPLPQTHAVHTLEHGAVIVYYRLDGPNALPQPVIDRLAQVVRAAKNSFLAPYPTLPEGTSLAFAAWNKLLNCPGTVTPDQAATIGGAFIHSLECTRNAPEPKASGNC